MKLQFFCSALSLRKTLWTGTLLLLLTACNSGTKAASGEGAGSETSSSVLIGDGNDNDPATYGISDANDTTALTVTLQSLILSLDKTSFNKDENTTVKVTARYEDGTSKDVTDKVEWIVNPKGSVAVTQKTLTAKKDNQTTIKAKVGNKLSNTINLNITWTVNGHTLPPEPDKALNDSTLLGIDANDNGVRDDIERKVYDTYPKAIQRAVMMQAFRADQKMLADPDMVDNARVWAKEDIKAIDCQGYLEEYKNISEMRITDFVENNQYNTKQRVKKYLDYDQALSGGVYTINEGTLQDCKFDVGKILELDK